LFVVLSHYKTFALQTPHKIVVVIVAAATLYKQELQQLQIIKKKQQQTGKKATSNACQSFSNSKLKAPQRVQK
jgi:hypothetical protein